MAHTLFILTSLFCTTVMGIPSLGATQELSSPSATSAPALSAPGPAAGESSTPFSLTSKTGKTGSVVEPTQAVSAGLFVLHDVHQNDGTIKFIEVEKKLTDRFRLFARTGWFEFQPSGEEGGYCEYGRGGGIEVGPRFDLAYRKQVDFYLGVGIGAWRVDWHSKREANTPAPVTDSRRTTDYSVGVHVGWKLWLGRESVYLNPAVQLGIFDPVRKADRMEFGQAYTSFSLALGKAW